MMKSDKTVVGVDTAKRVFQLHWVDLETGERMALTHCPGYPAISSSGTVRARRPPSC